MTVINLETTPSVLRALLNGLSDGYSHIYSVGTMSTLELATSRADAERGVRSEGYTTAKQIEHNTRVTTIRREIAEIAAGGTLRGSDDIIEHDALVGLTLGEIIALAAILKRELQPAEPATETRKCSSCQREHDAYDLYDVRSDADPAAPARPYCPDCEESADIAICDTCCERWLVPGYPHEWFAAPEGPSAYICPICLKGDTNND